MAGAELFFTKDRLQQLIDELRKRSYRVIGPTIDQDAIVYDEICQVSDFPRGWSDEQSPGAYRLKKRTDDSWFGFSVGPHSWKAYLFPSRSTLLSAKKTEAGWEFVSQPEDTTKYAFIGVRACELAAIRLQNEVFLNSGWQDSQYSQRSKKMCIIAVNCTQAATTCFCTSMKTGPKCTGDFDLALTEIHDGFVCEVGSELGQELVQFCSPVAAIDEQIEIAAQNRQIAIEQITCKMETDDLPGLLLTNQSHPHWKEVGDRCLSCTNCTMVCPTCFCSSVQEVRDLNMDTVERQRTWDSCFNPDFSYLSGGLVRNDTASRYRQWLTHKLDSWHSQFGTSGCVGCGRYITWCPVGIDITEEVQAFRKDSEP